MNTFGETFRLTDYGESHGKAIGGVIDGVPPRFRLDMDRIRLWMARRRPGCSRLASQREEPDEVDFLSGITEGNITLGTPIGFIIRNRDARKSDYGNLEHVFRPNHADYTYMCRYGIREWRGGGRSSARETACRMVGGAVALQFLHSRGIEIRAFLSRAGSAAMPDPYANFPSEDKIYSSDIYCPDPDASSAMRDIIEGCRGKDSVGGIVSCIIRGVPAGFGNPVFGKTEARLGAAMLGINAARGVEFGAGFAGSEDYGSQALDIFDRANHTPEGLRLHCPTNNCGGIQGGITNGDDITLSVAFKPTPTLPVPVETMNDKGEKTVLQPKGRHDPCVALRAVPVVTAMAAITVLDIMLSQPAADWSNL